MKEPNIAEVTQAHIDRIEAFKTFKQDEQIEIGDMKIKLSQAQARAPLHRWTV